MTVKKEIRGGIAADIRSDDSGVVVSGYAAVFNQRSDIGGYFYEVITQALLWRLSVGMMCHS